MQNPIANPQNHLCRLALQTANTEEKEPRRGSWSSSGAATNGQAMSEKSLISSGRHQLCLCKDWRANLSTPYEVPSSCAFYTDFLDQPQLQTQPKHSPKLCLETDKRPASSQGCTTYRNCINKTLRPYTKLLLGRLCARKLHSLSQANVTVNTCGQAARTAVCVGTEQAVRTISS